MDFGKTFQRLFEFETDTGGQIHLEGYPNATIPYIYNNGQVKNHFLKTGGKFLNTTDKSAQVKELMIRYLHSDAIMIYQPNVDFDLADMAKIQEFIATDVKELINQANLVPLVLDGTKVDGSSFPIDVNGTFAPTGHKPMRSEFADIIKDTVEPPKSKKGKGKKKEGKEKEGKGKSFDRPKPGVRNGKPAFGKRFSLFQKLRMSLKGKTPTSVFPPLQPQVFDSRYVKPIVAVPLALASILGPDTFMSVKSDYKQDLSTLNNNGLKRTESQCIAAMRGAMRNELSRYGDVPKKKEEIHYVPFQTKQGTTTFYVLETTRMAFVHSTFTGSMIPLDIFEGTGSGIDLDALHKELDLHRSIQLPSFFVSDTTIIFDTLIDKIHPFTLFFNIRDPNQAEYDVYYIDYDGVTIQGLDTTDYTFVGKTKTTLLGEPSTVVIPPTKPMKKKKEIVPPKKKVVQMVQYISLYDGKAGATDFNITKVKFPLDDTVQGLINDVLPTDKQGEAMAWKTTAKKLKAHVDLGKDRFDLEDIPPGDKGVQANNAKLLEDVIYIIEKRPENFDDSVIEEPEEEEDDLTIAPDLGVDEVEDFEELEAQELLGDRINAKK